MHSGRPACPAFRPISNLSGFFMKFKRLIASFLMVSILWASVVVPAKAFVLPLIAMVLEAASADAAFSTSLALSSAAVGSAIAFIKFHDPVNNSVFTVQLHPKAPLETPGGWSPPTTTVQPMPPATTTASLAFFDPTSCLGTGSTPNYASMSLLAGAMNTARCGATNGTEFSAGVGVQILFNGSFYTNAGQINTCSAGYSLISGSCNLSDALVVIKPVLGRDMLIRTGNTYSHDPQQNAADVNTLNSVVFSSPAAGQLIYKNPNTGEVTRVTTNQTDGTTIIETTKPNPDGVTSNRDTTTLTAPGVTAADPPKVSGQKHEALQGVGDAVGPSPGTSSSAPVTVDTSNLATHSDVSTVGSKIDASNTKLDAIKNALCGGSGQPPCKLDETGTPGTFTGTQSAGLDAQADSLVSQIQNQRNGAGQGLSIEPITNAIPATSQCVNPGFDASDIHAGAKFTLPLCEHASQVQPYLRWVVWIFTAIGIWGIWFQKLGGA